MSSVDRPDVRVEREGADVREPQPGQSADQLAVPPENPRAESAIARDRRWVEGTRRHDEAVFDDMFVAFHASMLRYAVLHLGTRDESDDVVQDVFIDIWKLGERWTVRGSVSAYLFGALRHKIIDAVRRRKRRARWFERAERGDEISAVLPRPSATEERVEAQELDERIK